MLSLHGKNTVRVLETARIPALKAEAIAKGYPERVLADEETNLLRLLFQTALNPLNGFLNSKDYWSSLNHGVLSNGVSWPIPYTLEINAKLAKEIEQAKNLVLRNEEGRLLGIVRVNDIFSVKQSEEERKLTNNQIATTKDKEKMYVGGKVDGVEDSTIYALHEHFMSPEEFQTVVKKNKSSNVIGCSTTGLFPLSRMKELEEKIPSNSTVLFGLHTNTLKQFPSSIALKSLNSVLPKSISENSVIRFLHKFPHSSPQRSAELSAIILKNFGCSKVIFSDSSPSLNTFSFADDVMKSIHSQCGKLCLASEQLSSLPYTQDELIKSVMSEKALTELSSETKNLILSKNPPKNQKGMCLFFTGLSGSGKSTVGNTVKKILEENDQRPIVLLDGDVVRHNLSKGLGFSKEDRDTNILRIGYVASLISHCGGIAICAPIAPYANVRDKVRRMVTDKGGSFVEIHVSTSLAECEKRDTKGLYAKARKGLVKNMTGIDDPYEEPERPEVRLSTEDREVSQSAGTVMKFLKEKGLIAFEI